MLGVKLDVTSEKFRSLLCSKFHAVSRCCNRVIRGGSRETKNAFDP